MKHFDTILASAAVLFDCREEDLIGRSRTPRLVAARQAVMWAARHAGYGSVELGRRMRRDHTTVLYGSQQAAQRAETDPGYARLLRELAGIAEPHAEPPRRVPVVRVAGYALALAA